MGTSCYSTNSTKESGLHYFGYIDGYGKEPENISPPNLYAELKQGSDKNGEPDDYLRYLLPSIRAPDKKG